MDRNQARPSAGYVPKRVSHSGSATQGCALRVQKRTLGLGQKVLGNVAARTATEAPGAAVLGFDDDRLCAAYTRVGNRD